MPDEVGPPNGAAAPKRCFASASKASSQAAKRVRTSRNARARACAAMRSRMMRAVSRSSASQSARARGDEVRLRAQDDAVIDHLQPVGRERRAGGGDVDDQLGGAGRRRAFGRAEAFDDAVVDDAVRGEEIARQVHVFGGDAHLAVVREAERGGDIVEIGHAAHVDPGLRHRDHDIGMTEAEPFDQHHALYPRRESSRAPGPRR